MRQEGFAGTVSSPPLVEVRDVGGRTFEARTKGGLYSAVGGSGRDAVQNLRNRLPLIIVDIPLPKPTSD
jgi:hypothetical protein